jgi:thymidylate synthase ThyX
MPFSARVLLDSISPAGVRLTTMEVTFPRFVLSEFNTHRQFSRNSSSARAIPTSKMLERVENDPVIPVEWGRNKKGMSAEEELSHDEQALAQAQWLVARDAALDSVRELVKLQVHKQVVNRLLEPFLWHTVIVTATEWDNFFQLRLAPNAQPEIRVAAQHMKRAYDESTPTVVGIGEWHLPLVQDDERTLDIETQKQISAARCARVSYLTHAGTRSIEADLELFTRLKTDRHLSPFEHVATPSQDGDFHANFRGWVQMRKEIEGANNQAAV